MLSEEKNVSQVRGEPLRRWFADDYFDLIVWLTPEGSFWGFQLCYDRGYNPRVLTWTAKDGYKHSGIDDGEGAFGAHKQSPVLVEDGLFDAAAIGKKLAQAAAGLPPEIKDFVTVKVAGFK